MSTAELRRMKYRELVEMKTRVEEILSEKAKEEKAKVKQELSAIARDKGFDARELFGVGSKVKHGLSKRFSASPKYRNPTNPSQTWSGRGRPPKWLDRSTMQTA